MPTLVRINTDIDRDFSQNKRKLNVFIQLSIKRRDVDEGNSLPSIIFRDFLSIAPVSSVKSSSLKHISVFRIFFSLLKSVPGRCFSKKLLFLQVLPSKLFNDTSVQSNFK